MNQFRQSEIERKVLTEDAVAFLIDLENEFSWRRGQILARRQTRQEEINQGVMPDFDPATSKVRDGDWTIAGVPDDLQDRRVEITGPVDRKMMINALNSGAKVFMADFEDATSPTWDNLLEGHLNIVEAYEKTTVTVEPGDNQWRLATEHLEDVLDRTQALASGEPTATQRE